jgi:HSP20 family protein
MAPKNWDPGHELQALRERMSRLFAEDPPRGGGPPGGAFAPATDVYLTDESVVITVELPGLTAEDVAIRCEGLALTISGERPFGRDGHCHQMERSYGPFLRTLPLPPGVKPGERRVRFEDGLLTVELPRRLDP